MQILVIGGTRFVGRHLVNAALDRGHEVTLFHRGRTGAELFRSAAHRYGDRDRDLSTLASGSWDATIDVCAYVPRHVRTLAEALSGRGGHYTLVSSVAAYADPPDPGIDESAPLAELADPDVEEVTGETYGGLKALCERAAEAAFGSGALIVRPTYVVGPHDYTWRLPWWVMRLARGGEVLAPGPPDAPIQLIDVRDLAEWMLGLVERRAAGAFHAASTPPPFSFADTLEAIRAEVAPPDTLLSWVDDSLLASAGQSCASLPLWTGEDPGRFTLAVDPAAANATGLSPRPLRQTVRDIFEWARSVPAAKVPKLGFNPRGEAKLLSLARSSGRAAAG